MKQIHKVREADSHLCCFPLPPCPLSHAQLKTQRCPQRRAQHCIHGVQDQENLLAASRCAAGLHFTHTGWSCAGSICPLEREEEEEA